MGKPSSSDPDVARGLVAGTFTATGQSAGLVVAGGVNVSLWGTFAATVRIQRSFDGGTTWIPLATPDGYGERTVTTPLSFWLYEFEDGVLYRLDCTWSSGTVSYRLSL